MKKLLIFILLTVISFGAFEAPSSYAYFRVNEITKDTQFNEGIRHTKVVASLDYDGVLSDQVMNYIGANIKDKEDLHIVTADNYYDHQDENGKWGMFNIHALVDNIHSRYSQFEVMAGVNGDFYDINNTGRPIAVYIRNFEVIYGAGGNSNRPVVGFEDDGDAVYGIPQFDGYELLVYNDEGQLKNKVKIDRINSNPQNDSEISVYFDHYLNALPDDLNKVYIDGMDTKLTEANGSYFGKGTFQKETTSSDEILENQFVIAGKDFNNDDLITESDIVIVQQDVIGDFEDVRYAIGTDQQPLVVDGAPNATLNAGAAWNYRAPRTAIGVKDDGTIFFVVVDGRNMPMNMDGVTLRELGEVMAYFGADQAYNLDGGGSSTMTLKDFESEEYLILNTPSDGRLRSISNGVFIVKGEHEITPEPIPTWPDTRDQLEEPEHIYVQEGVLRFTPVSGAAGYDVMINDEVRVINDTELVLDLPVGTYEISVRAKGGVNYKSSDYAESFMVQIYPHDIQLLIDMIKDFTRSETGN